jgi:hypothetical protein
MEILQEILLSIGDVEVRSWTPLQLSSIIHFQFP